MRTTRKGEIEIGGPTVYLIGINSGVFGALNLNAIWFTDVIAELVRP
jgi:hypothetical protein